jgi:two-component system, OmpR family, copper resistance phosphate regulon response regulator CusR
LSRATKAHLIEKIECKQEKEVADITDGKANAVKGRVLFLDDNEDTRELLDIVLSEAGYEIVLGRSLAEGLQLVKSSSFDLILLDWYFNDGTGLDLCRTIRESDGQTPIFFYTGMAMDNHMRKALQAGAQGCFIKPVDMETLLETISAQISRKKYGSSQERV